MDTVFLYAEPVGFPPLLSTEVAWRMELYFFVWKKLRHLITTSIDMSSLSSILFPSSFFVTKRAWMLSLESAFSSEHSDLIKPIIDVSYEIDNTRKIQ